jgi:hypothetical protein
MTFTTSMHDFIATELLDNVVDGMGVAKVRSVVAGRRGKWGRRE